MEATFDRALRFVFGVEGGAVHHPLDRGGSTNYGITQSAYAVYLARKGLPQQPVKFISRDEARDIYLHDYWLAGKCDRMPEPVAVVHFDACVNHGADRAARLLQSVAGVSADGAIGPATMAAIRRSEPEILAHNYITRRRRFYREIVDKIPSQAAFYKGWLNRMDALTKEIESA